MREVELGTVCEIKNGYAFKSSEFLTEGVSLIRISNFDNGPVSINKSSVFVDQENLNTKRNFLVEKGDVLIALSGATTGKYGFYDKNEPSLLNQRIGLLKSGVSKELNDRYFYHYLSVLQDKILRKAGGAAQPNISTKAIGEFQIPLPPLPTQKKIAAILDEADAYRQKTKALIAKYDELTQSLFLDMFGDPVRNEKGWEEKSLGEITIKIGSGSTPRGGKEAYKESGISLIRSMNVYDTYFKYNNLAFIDDIQASKLKNVEVKENDVLFNITGASVCRCTIVPADILPARVNQHVAILRVDEKIINAFYLMMNLTSTSSKTKLIGVGTSGGATREAITKVQLEEFSVTFPSLKLQNQFAERVEAIEAQKAQAQRELEKAEELFGSLLQGAFKGKLSLP